VALGAEHVQNIKLGTVMKKGVFFSMILVFVLIFMILFIFMQQDIVSTFSSQRHVESRVNSMIGFSNSIELDSVRAVGIIGKRAISAATNYIVANGKPLSSANVTISELILNGTINGTSQSLMNGSITKDWENTVEAIGAIEGFNSNVAIINATVQPEDSFHLIVSYMISVNVSDSITQAKLAKTSIQTSEVSVENAEDPLFLLNTYGRIVSTISMSPHLNNYSSTDPTNLMDDYSNSYYHPSLIGGSFLDRLEGQYTVQTKYLQPVPTGLERFVDKDKISAAGLSVNTALSNIDYYYFSGNAVTSYSISGMPSSFKLDNQTTINGETHIQIYNATVIQ
jgi:hypothetical protein